MNLYCHQYCDINYNICIIVHISSFTIAFSSPPVDVQMWNTHHLQIIFPNGNRCFSCFFMEFPWFLMDFPWLFHGFVMVFPQRRRFQGNPTRNPSSRSTLSPGRPAAAELPASSSTWARPERISGLWHISILW